MSNYIVKSGDTLGSIALSKTGNWDNWIDIVNANPQLSGRKTATDGSPIIYAGDNLIIPGNKENPKVIPDNTPVVVVGDGKQDFALLVDGKKFTGFTGFKIELKTDEFDSFSFSAPFDFDNKDMVNAFKPFVYKSCALYFDGKMVFNGTLMTSAPSVSADGIEINIQGYPVCGLAGECSLPESLYPPAYEDMTLDAIASDAAGGLGISIEIKGDVGGPFKDPAYEVGENVLDFLTKLAQQRGLIITNNEQGALLFWTNPVEGSCATFKEDDIRFIKCEPAFNSQEFYSHITGFSKVNEDKGIDPVKYTFVNPYLAKVGAFRPYVYFVDDSEQGDVEKAVMAKAAAMMNGAVKYSLSVTGVVDKDGNIFKKGCCVNVKAPSALINSETKLQANSIVISRDDTNGDMTTFNLVMPGLRTGDIPSSFPWE